MVEPGDILRLDDAHFDFGPGVVGDVTRSFDGKELCRDASLLEGFKEVFGSLNAVFGAVYEERGGRRL